MPYGIEISGLDRRARRGAGILELSSARHRKRVLHEVAVQSAKTLRGNRSLWPVDTGRSKRGFYVAANSSVIRNRAPYAVYVERLGRTRAGARPAQRTVQREFSRIVRRANRGLPANLRISGVRQARTARTPVRGGGTRVVRQGRLIDDGPG